MTYDAGAIKRIAAEAEKHAVRAYKAFNRAPDDRWVLSIYDAANRTWQLACDATCPADATTLCEATRLLADEAERLAGGA